MKVKRPLMLAALLVALTLAMPAVAHAGGFSALITDDTVIQPAATVRDYLYELKNEYTMDSESLLNGADRVIKGRGNTVVYVLDPAELDVLIVYQLPEDFYFEDTNARNVIFKTSGEALSYDVIAPDNRRFTIKFGTEEIAEGMDEPQPKTTVVTPLYPSYWLNFNQPYYGWSYYDYAGWTLVDGGWVYTGVPYGYYGYPYYYYDVYGRLIPYYY